MANITKAKAPPSAAGFVDTKQLLASVPVCRRTLAHWREKGLIPYINTGGRRILFHLPSVTEALLRQQRGGVS